MVTDATALRCRVDAQPCAGGYQTCSHACDRHCGPGALMLMPFKPFDASELLTMLADISPKLAQSVRFIDAPAD